MAQDDYCSDEEYIRTQSNLFLLAGLLAGSNLPGFLSRINRAESVGWIIDPTLYREAAGNLAKIKALAEAALPLWREAMTLRAEIDRGQPEEKPEGPYYLVAINRDAARLYAREHNLKVWRYLGIPDHALGLNNCTVVYLEGCEKNSRYREIKAIVDRVTPYCNVRVMVNGNYAEGAS